MTEANPQLLRAEHDAMLSRLSVRKSTLHFAHAAIGTLIGLILSGAAGKVWWDFGEAQVEWAALIAVGGVSVICYAAARWVMGRRALASEVSDFAKLKVMREELRLDDPSKLLP